MPCKVCSENVILVSLDNFTWCEYSRMWMGFGIKMNWFWFCLPLMFVVLGNMHKPSEPHFVHLWIGVHNSNCLPGLSWVPKEIMFVQFLAHSRYTVIMLMTIMRFSAKRNRLAISGFENVVNWLFRKLMFGINSHSWCLLQGWSAKKEVSLEKSTATWFDSRDNFSTPITNKNPLWRPFIWFGCFCGFD